MVLILNKFSVQNGQKSNGFGVLELVVVLFVFTITVVSLIEIYMLYNLVHAREYLILELQNAANMAISALRSTIVTSSSVEKDYTFSSGVVDAAICPANKCTTSDKVLVLKIPSLDSSQNVISSSYDYAVFYVGDGDDADTTADELFYTLQAASSTYRKSITKKQIARFVNKLIFHYNNTDLVKTSVIDIYLKTEDTRYELRTIVSSFEINTSINLRNR